MNTEAGGDVRVTGSVVYVWPLTLLQFTNVWNAKVGGPTGARAGTNCATFGIWPICADAETPKTIVARAIKNVSDLQIAILVELKTRYATRLRHESAAM